MSNYFTLQLHYEYGVIIDSDAFLGAFTMDMGGQRVKAGPWSLGFRPIHHFTNGPPAGNQEDKRVFMFKKWETYYWHAAGHIPYAYIWFIFR